MRIFFYFGVPFALYFIIAHPAIIYYNTHTPPSLDQKNPTLALIYLGIAVAGWMAVLIYLFIKIQRHTFGIRNGIRQLNKSGKLVNAIIESVTTRKPVKGFETYEIVVSFTNFNHTPITYTLILTDAKPHLNRYEPGKTIRLRVDQHLKNPPYVIPDDAEAKLKYPTVILLNGLWLIAGIGIISYFIYAYTTENQGYGWRFLTWHHPLIMSLVTAVGIGFIYSLIDKFILSKISGIPSRTAMSLLFQGMQATAKVKEVSQTGTYINEQPEVKFEMTFVDKKGTTHGVSLKKVVPLIHLQTVHQADRSILYLPDSPTTVAFKEDITA